MKATRGELCLAELRRADPLEQNWMSLSLRPTEPRPRMNR